MTISRKLHLIIDGAMVALWGLSALMRLLTTMLAHDWIGIVGVFVLAFIALAFADDYRRTRTLKINENLHS